MSGTTVWVLGDQLSHSSPALEGAERVLMIESEAKLRSLPFHRQKLHLVLSAMRHFAAELTERGLDVDYRRCERFADGVRAHRAEHRPDAIRVLEPNSRGARELCGKLSVEELRGTLFITHPDEFSEWAAGRGSLRMDSFYRDQRRRHEVLLDAGGPAGGSWSFDAENREPPPRDRRPPRPYRPRETVIDEQVRADLDALGLECFGEDGPRLYPATAAEAQRSLERFVETRLPDFGPWQDAILDGEEFMWHSMLSPALNLGLLDPLDCVRAAERAYREGDAPIASVEGFVRQILGWREYVWGTYWHERRWERMNALEAREELPELLWSGETEMECLRSAVAGLRETGYSHHIRRLMLFGNLMLLWGIDPRAGLDWFHGSFVDGYEWVMAPNVLGMATYADGGTMMTKPYAAGGRYVDRMSDHCGSCRYRPDRRTGVEACPLSASYWTFLRANRAKLGDNHRLRMAYRNLDRIDDSEMREIAAVVHRARG